MPFTMTRAEREAFLAGLHVGVLAVAEAGRGPLVAPIWYGYTPGGDVHIVTSAESRKAALIRAAGRGSLCVQTETAPYKYVTVEGPVVLATPDFERDLRQVAIRYLGVEGGERYLKSSGSSTTGNVLLRLTPEHWLTVDYGKR